MQKEYSTAGKCLFASIILLISISCKMKLGQSRTDASNDKILKLHLNPESGANYNYVISNESNSEIEANDKKTELVKEYKVDIDYAINKDSNGNILLQIHYNKIHIYSKTGDVESDVDASKAIMSTNPLERILGALKAANITAAISSSGEIRAVNGLQEIADNVLSQIKTDDILAKTRAQQQWKQMVEQNLIKRNMEQLFKIFPDSAVHVGDKWKLFSNEKEDINFKVKTFYTLTSIDDGYAKIKSEGEILSDSATFNLMGQQVGAVLKGEENGNYNMNVQTGMLVNCAITSKVTGTIQILGQEIPVNIKTKIKIAGKKVKG